MKSRLSALILAFFTVAVSAGELPTKLFGIELLKSFNVPEDQPEKPTFPAEFVSAETSLGAGQSIYFKPRKDYKDYPYKEYPQEKNPQFPTTSFRMYVHPVLTTMPLTPDTWIEEWRVVIIEYSTISDECDKKCEEKNYYKAITLCGVFAADLGIEPEILEYDRSGQFRWSYACSFVRGDIKFEVSSFFQFFSVTLGLTSDAFDKADDAITRERQKAYAKENSPYN